VEVDAGARLGDLRAHLAKVTGHLGWAGSERLAVGARPLDDAHPCGTSPLVAGAVLRLGRGPRSQDEAALRASVHLAVVAGPDCGGLLAVTPGTVVGRRGSDELPGAAGALLLADPLMSSRHLELRPHHRGARARDLGSSNGTTLRRARRSLPRLARADGRLRVRRGGAGALRGRWTALRPGDQIVTGASVLELRSTAREQQGRPAGTSPAGPSAWTWATPAAGSVALAIATGHRALLLVALIGPLLGMGQVLAERRRRARGRPAAPSHMGSPVDASPDGTPLRDPSDLARATLRACGAPGTPRFGADLAVPDRVLCIVGPRPQALGCARAVALAAVGTHGTAGLTIRADPALLQDWSWARWLTSADAPTIGPGDGQRHITVVDGPASIAGAARHLTAAAGEGRLVVLAPTLSSVPAWCRTVLRVDAHEARLSTPFADTDTPLQAVSEEWADAQARRVAGLRLEPRARPALAAAPGDALLGTPGGGADGEPAPGTDNLPRVVSLGDLPGMPPPTAAAVAEGWATGSHAGLEAVLGQGATGPVRVDLVRDGPHALVAGTTGAGKSALLRTLVMSLALAHPPERLAIALIDYKGGASFGPCAELPHVVGQVTDLDGRLALRALAGLRAELRRREHTLAAAGCADLAALWAATAPGSPTPPPRLLVVVDEFRALADEAPDFIPGLLRLAAQGRSLGMHLVLATQRPAGAVNADLRANIALRIALRVTDATESLDVIDVPDAAGLPADRPGRAALRRSNGPVELLQVAQIRAPGTRPPVRLAPAWATPPAAAASHPAQEEQQDDQGPYLAAVHAAAQGHDMPRAPWLPELPPAVRLSELGPPPVPPPPRHGRGAPSAATSDDVPTTRSTVPLALADLPDEQRRAVVGWDPARGHLLVQGAPGSGRTTTLRTAAAGALALGWDVHAVGLSLPGDASAVAAAGMGTTVDVDDPRRLARLLSLLMDGPHGDGRPGQLLVVDGWEAALEALDAVGRGGAGDLLLGVVRDGLANGVTVAAACGPTARTAALGGLFQDRIVLGLDPVDQVLAGVPAELATRPRRPGRAVHLHGADARDCQVAEPDRWPALSGRPPAALRLRPVPRQIAWADLGGVAPDASRAAVGRGGDDAAVTFLDVTRGALVVGPAGSGRTSTLTVIATGLIHAGRAVAVVSSDAALLAVPGARWASEPTGLAALLDTIAATGRRAGAAGADHDVDLVVDDLDVLEQSFPVEAERLASAVGRVRLIASARTARAATAYREPMARMRAIRQGLVLDPAEPGSSDVFGVDLARVTDPAHPHAAGRGAVVRGRLLTPVQVALPPSAADGRQDG